MTTGLLQFGPQPKNVLLAGVGWQMFMLVLEGGTDRGALLSMSIYIYIYMAISVLYLRRDFDLQVRHGRFFKFQYNLLYGSD